MTSGHESWVESESNEYFDVFDFMEQTAQRAHEFYANEATLQNLGFAPHPIINTESFNQLMQNTADALTQHFIETGGMKVSYIDDVTNGRVITYIFGCVGYDPRKNKWNMIGTFNGRPPVKNEKVLDVTFFTNELRESYERANIL